MSRVHEKEREREREAKKRRAEGSAVVRKSPNELEKSSRRRRRLGGRLLYWSFDASARALRV